LEDASSLAKAVSVNLYDVKDAAVGSTM